MSMNTDLYLTLNQCRFRETAIEQMKPTYDNPGVILYFGFDETL